MYSQYLHDFEHELNRLGKSAKTIKDYVYNTSLFIQYVEDSRGSCFDLPVLDTQVRDYTSFLQNVEKKSVSTINARLAAIQNFTNFCHTKYGTPLIKVERKKNIATNNVDILTSQEFNRLKDVIYKNGNKLHIAIFEMFHYGALREEELCKLEYDPDMAKSDVVLTDRKQYVIVRNGKGGKYREVPLSPKIRKPLSDYLSVRPNTDSNKFFIGNRGTLTPNGVYKLIRRYGEMAGITYNVYPHMLRHQCLTEMAKHVTNVQDIKNLQAIAGHNSAELTIKYYIANTRNGMENLAESIE